jgi:hypothetical protein
MINLNSVVTPMTTSFRKFSKQKLHHKMEPSTSSLKFVAIFFLSTAKKSPSTDTTDSNS